MKLVLTNRGRLGVPVCGDEGNLATVVGPGEAAALESTDDVWVVGDKPNFAENIKHGIEVILDLLNFFRNRRAEVPADEGVLSFVLENQGDKGVRVIPGTVDTEFSLAPGETRDTTAVNYIELRELGA